MLKSRIHCQFGSFFKMLRFCEKRPGICVWRTQLTCICIYFNEFIIWLVYLSLSRIILVCLCRAALVPVSFFLSYFIYSCYVPCFFLCHLTCCFSCLQWARRNLPCAWPISNRVYFFYFRNIFSWIKFLCMLKCWIIYV